MAIEEYREKNIPNNIQTAGSVASTPATETTSSTSTPIPIGQRSTETTQSVSQSSTTRISEEVAEENRAAADREAAANSKAVDEIAKTKKEAQNQQTASKYREIMEGEGTPYEKLSKIMDDYLSKNDPEYQKLPDYSGNSYSKDKKRQYRDQLIAELRKDFAPGVLSQAERKEMLTQLSALFTSCAAQGKTIESVIAQGKGAIKSEIDSITNKNFNNFMDKVDLEGTSDDEIILGFADQIFSKKDPNYSKLSSQEKLQYIKKHTPEITKQILGIDISEDTLGKLDDESLKLLEKAAVMAIKEVKTSGYSISDIKSDPSIQNKILSNIMNNKEFIAQIKEKLPNLYDGVTRFIEKNKIIIDLKSGDTNKVITENDVYNELLRRKKNGSLTKSETEMLRFYDSVKEMDKEIPGYSKKILSQKASNSSLIAKAAITGKTVPEYIKSMLIDDNGQYLTGKNLEDKLKIIAKDMNGDIDPASFKALYSELTQIYKGDNKAAFQAMKNAGLVPPELFKMRAATENKGELAAEIDNIVASCGSKEDIATNQIASKISMKFLDVKQSGIYLENQTTNIFDRSIAQGINEYKTKEEAVQIHSYFVNSENVSDARKSGFTTSLVTTTDDPTRQLYYAQEFSKIDNAAVTEGLAAATNSVDESVRSQYSQYVDYAVQNHNYTPEQKANIEQARQTGQTLYQQETNESVSTNVSSGKSTSAPNSASVSSVKSSSGQSSFVSNLAKSNSATNFANQVTSVLNDKKDRVQERLEKIIDNYRNSQKAAEAKISSVADDADQIHERKTETQIAKDFISEETQTNDYISHKMIAELKSAYSTGGLASLYNKLGEIGSNAQQKFLSYLTKYSDSSTILSFASKFSGKYDLIMQLYDMSNDPRLLSYLNSARKIDLLEKGQIALSDFLKYADSFTIAQYIKTLHKTGNQEGLRQILGLLGNSKKDYAESLSLQSVPGSDEWYSILSRNSSLAPYDDIAYSGAQMGSTKGTMARNYDKQKMRGPIYYSA